MTNPFSNFCFFSLHHPFHRCTRYTERQGLTSKRRRRNSPGESCPILVCRPQQNRQLAAPSVARSLEITKCKNQQNSQNSCYYNTQMENKLIMYLYLDVFNNNVCTIQNSVSKYSCIFRCKYLNFYIWFRCMHLDISLSIIV